jgi:hypothetical protein
MPFDLTFHLEALQEWKKLTGGDQDQFRCKPPGAGFEHPAGSVDRQQLRQLQILEQGPQGWMCSQITTTDCRAGTTRAGLNRWRGRLHQVTSNMLLLSAGLVLKVAISALMPPAALPLLS